MDKLRIDLVNDPLQNSTTRKIYLWASIAFFLAACTMLTLSIINGTFGFSFESLNPVLYMLLSIGYILQALQIIRVKKSKFIEFSDNKIQFQLGPKSANTKIRVKDIEDIDVQLLSVVLTYKKGKQAEIPLNDMTYSDIQDLKTKFFELKSSLDTVQEEETETA